MKVLKGKYDLILIFFFPFLIIPIVLFIFAKPWLGEIYRVNVLCSLITLLLLVMPHPALGHFFSTNAHKKTQFLPWFSALFVIQFILNLFCCALFYFMKEVLPVPQPLQLHTNITLFAVSAGLFPWGFCALVVLVFKYFIYDQKQPPLISSTLKNLFQNTELDSVGIATNSYMRSLALTLMCFSVALFMLALMSLLSYLFSIHIETGVKFYIVLVNIILLTLYGLPSTQSLLRYLIFNIPFIFLIILFSVVVSVVFILFNTAAIKELIPQSFSNIFTLTSQNSMVDFKITLSFLWLGLSVFAAVIMSYLSSNVSGKQFIFWSLISNGLGWLVIYYLEIYLLPISWVVIIIMLFSLLSLFALVGKKNLTYLLRATLPTNKHLKPRPPNLFIRGLLHTALLISFTYLLIGLKIMSFLITISFLPSLIVIFMSILSFLLALTSINVS